MEKEMAAAPAQPPKLLDRVTNACRVRHFSPRTAETYRDWARRFILFHDIRHPDGMREPEVNAFLSHLAVDRDVSASTQNQALAALLFLYDAVLGKPLNELDVVRANRPKRLPTVMTRDEVRVVLAGLEGVPRLVCLTQYGAGLRLLEALTLRVKDIDFGGSAILLRDGKGFEDRRVILPAAVAPLLKAHLTDRRASHDDDLRRGRGRVPMPNALARKFPNADREWGWQWVFPAATHYTDRKTGV
jgi:integron integrase